MRITKIVSFGVLSLTLFVSACSNNNSVNINALSRSAEPLTEKKGIKTIYSNDSAFAALKHDGSVVSWGAFSFIDTKLADVSEQLKEGVKSILGTENTFVAITNTGKLVSWGETANNSELEPVKDQLQRDVTAVYATEGTYAKKAFAALKKNGSVVTWGINGHKAADSSNVSGLLQRDVVEVYPAGESFVARKTEGSLISWGDSRQTLFNGRADGPFINVKTTYGAYLGLLESGRIFLWGDTRHGSDHHERAYVRNNTRSDVKAIYSNSRAFAILKTNGSVLTWGDSAYGGEPEFSTSIGLESDVSQIYPYARGFVALRKNNSIVRWGAFGPDANRPQKETKNFGKIKKVESTLFAFAVIRDDDTVASWGHDSYGANSSEVSKQLVDVKALFSTDKAFAALKKDGSVITWGDPEYGGDSSKVEHHLQGSVINIFSTKGAFAALKRDGTVVTWGNKHFGGDSSELAKELRP